MKIEQWLMMRKGNNITGDDGLAVLCYLYVSLQQKNRDWFSTKTWRPLNQVVLLVVYTGSRSTIILGTLEKKPKE